MPEAQSIEEFQHFHRDGIKDLDLEQNALAQARAVTDLLRLDDDLQNTLSTVRNKLAASSEKSPEHVFRQAMASLQDIDAKRFVIENALESLKRGATLEDTLARYQELGLISPPTGGDNRTGVDVSPMRVTVALSTRKSIFERVMGSVQQIAVNAVKSVPNWIEIEPHVGFVGPIPTISFALKAKGMTLYEFLEALRSKSSITPE
jgi:hypothetical protein